MNKRNTTIELFRYVAALMVVAIHTAGDFGSNSNLGFFVIHVLCRLAVPFFAVCTGYFSLTKTEGGGTEQKVCKQIYKLLKLYVVWSIIYLFCSIPMWISTGWFSVRAFLDYLIGMIVSGSHYHLWYLLSLLYAIPLYWLILKYVREKYFLLLSVSLWFVKVFSYGYREILPDVLRNIFAILDIFEGMRDAIFIIIPLMLLGTCIRLGKKKNIHFLVCGFAISFIGLLLEAFWLKNQGIFTVSYIFFTYPTACFLFQIILRIKEVPWKSVVLNLGKTSMFVYCAHPIIVETLHEMLSSNLLLFGITAIVTTFVGVLLEISKKRGVNNV